MYYAHMKVSLARTYSMISCSLQALKAQIGIGTVTTISDNSSNILEVIETSYRVS